MEKDYPIKNAEIIKLISEEFNRILKENIGNLQEKQQILSRKEAASYLKITLPTLSDYTKRGLIKAKRLGDRVLYQKQDLINSLRGY